MTEPLLIHKQRVLFRELARLIHEKTTTLAAVEQTATARRETAAKAWTETRQQVTARWETEKAAIEREYQEAVRTIQARYEREQAAARQHYETTRDALVHRYEQAVKEAERKHEELRWTTTTVCEANERAAKAPLESVQLQVAAALQKVHHLRTTANEWLTACRQWGIIDRVRFSGKANRHHDDPQRNLTIGLQEAEQDLEDLQALRLPRLFQGKRLLGVLLLLAGLLSAALWLRYPDGLVAGKHPLALVAGGGALLLIVAFSSLAYGLARLQVLRCYRLLCRDLADAELTCQRWLHQATKHYEQKLVELAEEKKRHDATLRQSDENYQKLLASLKERYDRERHQADQQFPALLASIEQRKNQDLNQAEEKRRRLLTEGQQRHDRELRQAEDTHRRALEQAQQEVRQAKQKWAHTGQQALVKARETASAILKECLHLFPPWRHPAWQQWRPPSAPAPVIRFGEYQVNRDGVAGPLLSDQGPPPLPDQFALPALLAFPQRCSMLYQAKDAGRIAAVQSLQAVMLRFLTTLPAGKVRFLIIDPVGLGENFSAFMHLADYDEQLVTSRIWTEPQQIDQRLADLAAHMENVIQKYLRNQYQSIEEYNAQAGEVAEPFRVLVVANFPVNFSPDAAKRLVSIASSGATCGVYTLISVDTRQPLPHGFNLADLEQVSSINLVWKEKEQRFVWKDQDFAPFPLQLDTLPDNALLNRLLNVVGAHAKEANRVEVPFDFIMPPAGQWWTSTSKEGIDVPLGRAGATKRQYLRLGKGTAQHVLIAGKTGSGKSTLMHALITNLSLYYSPEEVELYLVDFKKGVEFKTYVTHALPHARVVAVESEREFGMSVLQRLDAELRVRGDLFRKLGVQNISDYRDAPGGGKLPRILLIVDEFQEFFVEDDKLAQEAGLLLDRLVRQGRAFGLHVLLGSQTLGGAFSLARSTIDQMAVRIALQCSEADANLILSKENSAARLLSRPGEAIYNDANGLVEGNDIFQVVWLPDDRREVLLGQVYELARQRRLLPTRPPIVFEGNSPADVHKNRALHQLLGDPTWPATTRACTAWLGEAIAIKDPTAAVFRRQPSSNLLLIGQQEEATLGILGTALVSLAAQAAPAPDSSMPAAGGRFYIVDGLTADSPFAGFWQPLVNALPHAVQIGSWRELPTLLGEIAAEVERRQKTNEVESPPIFVFIHALQRFKELRRQDDDFGFSRRGEESIVPPSQLLGTILREGPTVGVHALIWCDTLTSLQRCFDRQTMRDFEMRVLFQMNANDSSALIDSPAASRLGVNRGLFSSEDTGQIEKFRPYGLPTADWLQTVRQQLRQKQQRVVASLK